MDPNRNLLWARVLADEFARHGLRHVALSPGSRSGPLAIGFRQHPGLDVTVHVDERSGGFFALGIGRATGTPTALVCTSGTAAANFFPAIVEAHESRVPLLVLTADRPPELRGIGSNQTIDQIKLYGGYVRDFIEVPLPEPAEAPLRHLRSIAARAWGMARGPPAGPVHLNLPFREPLAPVRVPGDIPAGLAERAPEAYGGRADGRPFAEIPPVAWSPGEAVLEGARRRLSKGHRGVIVVGPRNARDGFSHALRQLAVRLGVPILADPLSGLRYGDPEGALVVPGYDAFLASPTVRNQLVPDWILRFGAAPTSKNLKTWITAHADATQIVVDEDGRLHDEPRTAQTIVRAGAEDFAARLVRGADGVPAPASEWTDLFRRMEDATRAALGTVPAAWEGAIPGLAAEALGPQDVLFVSNSLPVRDLDRYGGLRAEGPWVLCNRGASGIDGILSTGAGAAHANGGRSILVVGDLAFHHDLNGLSAVRRYAEDSLVVILNNGGGAIFGLLPIAEHEPHFTELFLTPHDLDFEGAAKAYGLPYSQCGEGDLGASLLGPGRTGLLDVVIDRPASLGVRRDLERRVVEAVEGSVRAPAPARPV